MRFFQEIHTLQTPAQLLSACYIREFGTGVECQMSMCQGVVDGVNETWFSIYSDYSESDVTEIEERHLLYCSSGREGILYRQGL